MLHRFLPLATLLYLSVLLPAHGQAQQGAAGAVRGRIVESVEVEQQAYLKAVQADVRVALSRAAAVEFAPVQFLVETKRTF